MKVELDKAYNPQDFETRMYELWMRSGHFSPRKPQQGEKPFVIVIPPPNVTGVLHLGHGLNINLQDILIRYHRMMGVPTLWVPGTDHAGIATQHLVENRLREEGQDREQLGREKFLEEVWKTREEHHAVISEQLRKIGSSCDWNRERFTLDEGLSNAVQKVFVDLYERGLIYKGSYLINWSVGVQSAISDDEVEFKEINGFLYHLSYPLADGSAMVRIATTRPETMLGDTALAVHPDDERYAGLVGKKVTLPLVGREIPIIADDHVNPEFGTGAVKITPAHDFNDYEMGRRHGLPEISIMNPDGSLNGAVPEKYRGLSMEEARKAVVSDLEEAGLLIKKEPHRHQVGHCYRSDTVIEPYLSTQWFVKMQPLAEKALKALEDGKIHFFPRKWENTYTSWLNNIRDWCISRQLWWGHRIPAWYDTESGEMLVSATDPSDEKHTFTQDEDVLDTWFSSWLWPFSVMGWPDETEDMQDFFPTTSLVSGYDIIFFWIARMIMASLEFLGEVPFRDIYITGLVRDKKGRKMSKSLGNGLDPLDIVKDYGADALRFTLAYLSTQGQDILMDKETFGLGSRFANKIWNATRYLLMNLEETLPLEEVRDGLNVLDRWILNRLNRTAEKVHKAFESYRFNDASAAVHEFFWNDYCDWYIEASKLSLYSDDESERRHSCTLLMYVLQESLKLLHPFLPYLTEEIFQKLPSVADEGRVLMAEAYPAVEEWRNFPDEGFESLKELVRAVRTLRSEFNIPPNANIDITVYFEENFSFKAYIQGEEALLRSLTSAGNIQWNMEQHELIRSGTVAVAGQGFEAFVHIRSMIDTAAALRRFEKTLARESAALKQTEYKLANEGFLSKASPEVIGHEREKQKELCRKIEKLQGYVEDLRRQDKSSPQTL